MNKEKLIGCLLVVLMSFSACKKTSEKVIDCFGDSLLISVHVTVNATNMKQVATEVRYSGSKKVSGVKWEYGDGGTESTTSLTGSHTYASAGTYVVKARVTFTEGKSSCEVDPTKSVVIQ
jgi:hypothetical protein